MDEQPADPKIKAIDSASKDMDHRAAGRLLDILQGKPNAIDRPHLESVAGYVITDTLGNGSTSVVYKAMRSGSERPIALKLLRLPLGDGSAGQRVWRELDMMSQLRLPVVPRLLDYGVHEGRLFMATEYVHGRPLDQFCDTESLDIRERVLLIAQVADAVQSIHECGVIHRDIKPSNVLVDERGRSIIVDLGLASFISESVVETLTVEGVPIGTPAYMAPEQASGSRLLMSTRSDVYALGAVAYRILTGDTPHDMDTTVHDAIRRVAQDPPRDPRTLRPTLPRPLRAVLLKAVSHTANERYATSLELAEDLRRWTRGEPVTAEPALIRRRVARLITAHPLRTTLAACLLFVAGTLAATTALVWLTDRRPHNIVDDPTRAMVHLLTWNGNLVLSWPRLDAPDVFVDELLAEPSSAGGRRLAVVATPRRDRKQFGAVCAYDADSKATAPIWWQDLDKASSLPAMLPANVSADQFTLRTLHVHDIFTDTPGTEILAIYQHRRRSFCSVQVYSTGGHLLYQMWHDGNLSAAHWLADPSVLLLAGVNGEHLWLERSHPEQANHPHPKIVMGIRPKLGHIADAWTDPDSAETEDAPHWYRCVLPPQASSVFERMAFDDAVLADPDQAAIFSVFSREYPNAAIGWVIDERGTPIEQIVPDSYKARMPELPPAEQFYLGDLPPVSSPLDTDQQ